MGLAHFGSKPQRAVKRNAVSRALRWLNVNMHPTSALVYKGFSTETCVRVLYWMLSHATF